jgi:hypothetical protein
MKPIESGKTSGLLEKPSVTGEKVVVETTDVWALLSAGEIPKIQHGRPPAGSRIAEIISHNEVLIYARFVNTTRDFSSVKSHPTNWWSFQISVTRS